MAKVFILENKVAANVIRKFSVCLEPSGLLQCSEKPFNLSRPATHQSNISTKLKLGNLLPCSLSASKLSASESFIRHWIIVLRDGSCA
jgi:hypothetical protein